MIVTLELVPVIGFDRETALIDALTLEILNKTIHSSHIAGAVRQLRAPKDGAPRAFLRKKDVFLKIRGYMDDPSCDVMTAATAVLLTLERDEKDHLGPTVPEAVLSLADRFYRFLRKELNGLPKSSQARLNLERLIERVRKRDV